jgi:hypothetical protein
MFCFATFQLKLFFTKKITWFYLIGLYKNSSTYITIFTQQNVFTIKKTMGKVFTMLEWHLNIGCDLERHLSGCFQGLVLSTKILRSEKFSKKVKKI